MQKDGTNWIAPEGRRGRGAVSNAGSRFDQLAYQGHDDGWGTVDEELPPLRTQVTVDATRTIIARNTSPDLPFDQSINMYRGCEHGCIYCFARPTHAYLGLSPGLDFESRLFIKPEAPDLLRAELSAKKYRPAVIALGTNTDPYQPIEREQELTRKILLVLAEFNNPVGIVTKSHLVTRDIDILGPMAERGLARVALSVTTLDHKLARAMEPRASTPARRLDAIAQLAAAGIPTGVMTAPMIPALNDHEMERILAAAAQAGARTAGYVLLRLPYEIKDLFREWLHEQFPDRAKHIYSLIRSMRGGKDYDAEWNKRMRGEGPFADLIAQRFQLACKRLALNSRRIPSRTDLFRAPSAQGSLF